MKAQAEDYHEWIEFTWISGRKQIFCVGKEGWRCHCWRLNSNPDIIKVRRYSTEYPYDLIDTKGAKQSKHEVFNPPVSFKQVSWDKKTNTERTKTKTLISWRLLNKQEFENAFNGEVIDI